MVSVPRSVFKAQFRDALVFWLYLPAAVIGGGWGIDVLLHLPPVPTPPGHPITGAGVALLTGGVLLVMKTIRDLKRFGHGTPNPQAPPRELVTEGSYALCRHPMFFGYDLAALGVVLLFHSWGMLLVTYPLLLFGQIPILRKEEARLVRRFGARYRAYQAGVPFLLPFLPTRKNSP